MAVLEGTVVFSNVTKTDVFNGQDTGKFNLTLSLDSESASTLASSGVRLKDYEGVSQRKFASQYKPQMFDANGAELEMSHEIPYGSKVRIVYSLGKPHPTWGTSVYLNKVKVLELADNTNSEQDGGAAKGEF